MNAECLILLLEKRLIKEYNYCSVKIICACPWFLMDLISDVYYVFYHNVTITVNFLHLILSTGNRNT